MSEPLDLAPIEARLNAATMPPWLRTQWSDNGETPRRVIADHTRCYVITTEGMLANADAELIANAPTDIAALLAEVKTLRTKVLPRVKDGCACIYHLAPGPALPAEVEYEPACPEHSEHLYDPRSGSWIFRDPAKNAAWEAERDEAERDEAEAAEVWGMQ